MPKCTAARYDYSAIRVKKNLLIYDIIVFGGEKQWKKKTALRAL